MFKLNEALDKFLWEIVLLNTTYQVDFWNEFISTKLVLDLYTEMSINFSYCGLNVSGSDECSSIRQLVLRRTEHANERDIHLGW